MCTLYRSECGAAFNVNKLFLQQHFYQDSAGLSLKVSNTTFDTSRNLSSFSYRLAQTKVTQTTFANIVIW